jgi:hypothetical protein
VLKDAVSIYRTTRENAPALGRMPAFARLTAGANEIRNLGLTLNGMAAESAPAAIVLWREDLSLIRDQRVVPGSPFGNTRQTISKGPGPKVRNPLSSASLVVLRAKTAMLPSG